MEKNLNPCVFKNYVFFLNLVRKIVNELYKFYEKRDKIL